MTISHATIIDWLQTFAAVIAQDHGQLTALDAAIGDADHGVNMQRGMQAVLAKSASFSTEDIGVSLKATGMALLSSIGGASGPLYGTLFLELGKATVGQVTLMLPAWLLALDTAVSARAARGRASVGDKTMLDALSPAVTALRDALAAGASTPLACQQSAAAARAGCLATIPLVARRGRASYLGERSAQHQDPGATSATWLLETLASSVARTANTKLSP